MELNKTIHLSNQKVKILYFVDRMRVGGIQTLLIGLFEQLIKKGYEPELLLLDDGEEYKLEETVNEMGIKVHKLENIWLNSPMDWFKYRIAMKHFFAQNHDYVAVHMNSGPKNYLVLKYAKQYSIPVRIAHSHNSGFQTKSKIKIALGNVLKWPLRKNANVYLACSDLAGKWMFGQLEKVIVMPNGVKLKKFRYDEKKRKKIRAELGITDQTIVIGNIGRFVAQKNHDFILNVFNEAYQRNKNSMLMLVGTGELIGEIKQKARDMGLEKYISFLGYREDVPDILQGMDVLLMPSLYEGFPVTAVEAQASGLPCILSDTITQEAKISDNVKYLSLYDSAGKWAEKVLSLGKCSKRDDIYNELKEKGYDIENMADRLIEIYKGNAII